MIKRDGFIRPTTPYPRTLSYYGNVLNILHDLWNETTDLDSPFSNVGPSAVYESESFLIQPYDWGADFSSKDYSTLSDDEYWLDWPPNFMYKPTGAAAGWYKYQSRGETVNEAFLKLRLWDVLKAYHEEILSHLPPKQHLYIHQQHLGD